VGTIFGRPFVKRFALCYRASDRCPVVSVCDVGVLWPNGWMDQNEAWHRGRPRPLPRCVRREPSSPSPKGHSPQFSAHVCCGQTAGWIKMPLGTEVGLDPGNIVLDGDIAPAKKGHNPRLQPRSIVAKRSPISATAEHLFLFGVEMSDLNAVIFTGQPAGLSDRLLVGSAHESLDRFHICHYASPATHFF